MKKPNVIILAVIFFAFIHSQSRICLSQTRAASRGMVATQHPLATQAALEVLRRGGHAVDAAITAAFVLAVVEPYNSGLGGGGFMLLYDAKFRAYHFLDFRERAPLASKPELYQRHGKFIPTLATKGWLAVGVPGMVRGLFVAHEKFGNLAPPVLLTAAVGFARDGFPVDHVLYERLKSKRIELLQDSEIKKIFYRDGQMIRQGEQLKQSDLAMTLEEIASAGSKSFYEGNFSKRMIRTSKERGGVFSKEDFQRYQVYMEKPVEGRYRNFKVVSSPPPSSGGGVLLETLNIFSAFDLAKMQPGSADFLHLLAEAMKLSFMDRVRYYGDPRFVKVPLNRLLSRQYALQRGKLINMQRALLRQNIESVQDREGVEGNNTTHLCVVDEKGNIVSLTLSLNTSFGAGVMVPGTGVILNNQMDDFAIQPDVPNSFGLVGSQANALAAGKTPLSSMSPTIVTQNGHPILVLGSPGGPRIISSVLQVLINRLDFGLDLKAAVRAPRLHHQAVPDELFVEKNGFAPKVLEQLQKRGHKITAEKSWGNVQAIEIINADKNIWSLSGVSDPRAQGSARSLKESTTDI